MFTDFCFHAGRQHRAISQAIANERTEARRRTGFYPRPTRSCLSSMLVSSNRNTTRSRPRTTWNTSLPHLTPLSISHYHHLLSRQPIDHRRDHRLPISIVQRHRASIMRAARVPTTRPRVCQVVPIPMRSNHSSAYSMLPARCTRPTIISSTPLNYKSNSFVSACVYAASPSTMMGMIHHPVSISTIISMVKLAMANSDP